MNTLANKSVVKIGFQLPDPNVHDVTGFCAAEMAVKQQTPGMIYPAGLTLFL